MQIFWMITKLLLLNILSMVTLKSKCLIHWCGIAKVKDFMTLLIIYNISILCFFFREDWCKTVKYLVKRDAVNVAKKNSITFTIVCNIHILFLVFFLVFLNILFRLYLHFWYISMILFIYIWIFLFAFSCFHFISK